MIDFFKEKIVVIDFGGVGRRLIEWGLDCWVALRDGAKAISSGSVT